MCSIHCLEYSLDLELVTNVAVIILVVLSTATFILKIHFSDRKIRRDFSESLKIEIENNKKRLDGLIVINQVDPSYLYSNVYDGIISSGNIRFFKPDLQEKIHKLYVLDKGNNNLVSMINSIAELLDCMNLENLPLWKLIIKKLSFNKQ